jgi:hypothetical protein
VNLIPLEAALTRFAASVRNKEPTITVSPLNAMFAECPGGAC